MTLDGGVRMSDAEWPREEGSRRQKRQKKEKEEEEFEVDGWRQERGVPRDGETEGARE